MKLYYKIYFFITDIFRHKPGKGEWVDPNNEDPNKDDEGELDSHDPLGL